MIILCRLCRCERGKRRAGCPPCSTSRVEALDANVAVADEFFGVVAATVDLEGDAALGGVAKFGFFPFHDFDAIDPGGDRWRIADDAGAEFVPLAVTPEVFPGFGQDGELDGRIGDELDEFGLAHKAVVADGGFAAEAFAIDAHEVSAAVVIDHGLPCFAIFGAAEEEAAIGAEIVVHFEGNFEVSVLFISEDDAAVAGDVLGADDGAVLDGPFAAGLVFAGAAVAGFCADVPAFEGGAIEDGSEAVSFGGGGRKDEGDENDDR